MNLIWDIPFCSSKIPFFYLSLSMCQLPCVSEITGLIQIVFQGQKLLYTVVRTNITWWISQKGLLSKHAFLINISVLGARVFLTCFSPKPLCVAQIYIMANQVINVRILQVIPTFLPNLTIFIKSRSLIFYSFLSGRIQWVIIKSHFKGDYIFFYSIFSSVDLFFRICEGLRLNPLLVLQKKRNKQTNKKKSNENAEMSKAICCFQKVSKW